MMLSKFRGCMVGALIGDCFGAPYEFEKIVNQASYNKQLQKYFNRLEGPPFQTPKYSYTDDTALTKCLTESLIENKGFNARDVANKFVIEYFTNPNRGYGNSIHTIFHKLNDKNLKDVWAPAAEQFDGNGSYGNGGAMRISPVPLFCYKDIKETIKLAENATKITHTHREGIVGSILQALAIHFALYSDPKQLLDINQYCDKLLENIIPIEEKYIKVVEKESTYRRQLMKMKSLLLEKKVEPTVQHVVQILGNDVTALHSVPTAIYCFLRAQQPISEIETENPFRRTIQYAISLGGDTDTIASMAGAIAGACYGIEMINENLIILAEGNEIMNSLAINLYEQIN